MPQAHAERPKNIEKKSVTEILKRNNGRKRIKKEERKKEIKYQVGFTER